MKTLLSLITSLGICAITALPSYSLSTLESSSATENYYTTRNLITPSLTNTQIQSFKQQIHKEACSLGETRTLLQNGVTLRYRFWTPDGQLLNTWLLGSSTVNCNSAEGLPIQIINPSPETPKNTPITRPKQPINNLQLGLIIMVSGIIVTAIAKSRLSTPKTQQKPSTSYLKVNQRCNTITAFSLPSDKVEMFNFCSSNRSQIHDKSPIS